MKKTLIFVFVLVICLATMLTITACHTCEWSGDWTADSDTHFHVCTVEGCDKVSDQTAHAYDQKVETADYLDQEATATTSATYFFSCVCGKKGTTTFEKAKPLAEVSIKEGWLDDFSRQYDNKNTKCSQYTFENYPTGANLKVYYKPFGADDSEYQLQGDDVAENAGKYVMKAVIGETIDTAETILYHEFEITKIKGQFSSSKVKLNYTGTTSLSQLFTHYYYDWVVDGYNFYVYFTTTSKATGIYSTENGTLTLTTSNPNYELSGSIEIQKRGIDYVTATAEYKEDGIYTVKLGPDQNVKATDEVYLNINAGTNNKTGLFYVYYKPTTAKDGVQFVSLTGADAEYYYFWEGGLTNTYAIKFEIVAPTAE